MEITHGWADQMSDYIPYYVDPEWSHLGANGTYPSPDWRLNISPYRYGQQSGWPIAAKRMMARRIRERHWPF